MKVAYFGSKLLTYDQETEYDETLSHLVDGTLTEYEMAAPTGMTSIPDNFFRDCTSLKYVKIPEGITTIGANAFRGCTSLQVIDLPSTLTSIGLNAFGGEKYSVPVTFIWRKEWNSGLGVSYNGASSRFWNPDYLELQHIYCPTSCMPDSSDYSAKIVSALSLDNLSNVWTVAKEDGNGGYIWQGYGFLKPLSSLPSNITSLYQ